VVVSVAPDIQAAAAAFALPGEPRSIVPWAGGHINDSYVVSCATAGPTDRYFLQRINQAVFRNPPAVMENIRRVTTHMAGTLRRHGVVDWDRRVLQLGHTRAGGPYWISPAGEYWRIYTFVNGTHARLTADTPVAAEQAGRAFGEFQRVLADYAGPPLHETIPDFHNTPARFHALELAVQADSCGRVATARAEVDFAAAHRSLASVLLDLHAAGALPQRIVHNDAKISNVLLDDATGAALCVVDLDTVMPGLALYDFGDMVRSMTSGCAEDDPDSARITVQMPLYEGLARGYLATAGAFLNAAEKAHLVQAGLVITLEQGVRFLTDFLEGDRYYRTGRPRHNLDRCRTQFALVAAILRRQSDMERFAACL
jgi:hypothetical protein